MKRDGIGGNVITGICLPKARKLIMFYNNNLNLPVLHVIQWET